VASRPIRGQQNVNQAQKARRPLYNSCIDSLIEFLCTYMVSSCING
jgi:hypothetical protein